MNPCVPITHSLSEQLDRLSWFEPCPHPVVSLYLNLQPDARGRDSFDAFVRRELNGRLGTYRPEGPERASLERDREKIRTYLDGVDHAANGLALFTCSAAGLFEAMSFAAPIAEHRLYVSNQPHLYPLARVIDEYPRYAVLVADTNTARLFVVAVNSIERATSLENVKTKRHKMGGWSQARYQRHVDNFRQQHAREAVEALTRLVRGEQIPSVVIGGDDVIVAQLRSELPKDIAERVVDVVRLDSRAPEHDILQRSLEVLRRQDAQTDRERVEALLDAYRASGLGTLGVEAVRRALGAGQVQELLIASVPDAIAPSRAGQADASAPGGAAGERTAEDLVVKARQTGASIRFVEDAQLLKSYGGVGAFLRFLL